MFREVILYGQERDTAALVVTRNDPTEIRFTLTDRMLDEWYDYPLTVKVRIPDAWPSATATQAGKPADVRVVAHESKRYALVQAVPDRGEVRLTPR